LFYIWNFMEKSHKTILLGAVFFVFITVVAYIPTLSGGYIWDDNDHITENYTLRTGDGLRRIWFELGAVPQYYPMVHTSFWLEYHLWQLHPLGYHLVNVLLHALNAILLWLLLRFLRVPGGWLAALFFALHPVNVESVAWITERKNVLSGFFYLSSLLAYLRFAEVDRDPATAHPSSSLCTLTTTKAGQRWRFYGVSLILYLCALLSKTVACSLPVAILLILWWKRNRITRSDLLNLVPYFVIGAGLGLLTVWMEKHHVGAQGTDWALSLLDRFLIAGRALWFYVGKLLWPHKLTFIYPRWQIDAGEWWQYLFPATVLAVLFILWFSINRLGRGPLVAVLFFIVTLFPALGFFDVYPMRFSFVADHFQYLASIGLISLTAAGIATLLRRLGTYRCYVGFVVCLLVLLVFGAKVWQQGTIYSDAETIYRDTLSKNPNAWMAHNNLGVLLLGQDKPHEAIAHFYMALQINPENAEPHNNLGDVFLQQNKFDEAEGQFYRALEIKSNFPEALNNLGVAFERQEKYQEAIAHFERALQLAPNFPGIHNNLGNLLEQQARFEEALSHYSMALQLQPDFAEAHFNLGTLRAHQGQVGKAAAHFSKALQLDPDFAKAHNSLGVVLARQGRHREAIYHFRKALRLEPDFDQARNNLKTATREEKRSRDQ
jgi:Flp pilus assembly protein TadD